MGERFIPALEWYPDVSVPDQYAEISQDNSEVHVDPAVAQSVGLPGVVLHGMYLYGRLASHLAEHFASHDHRLISLSCRFLAPALPGYRLSARFMQPEPDRVVIRVEQRGQEVLQGEAMTEPRNGG